MSVISLVPFYLFFLFFLSAGSGGDGRLMAYEGEERRGGRAAVEGEVSVLPDLLMLRARRLSG